MEQLSINSRMKITILVAWLIGLTYGVFLAYNAYELSFEVATTFMGFVGVSTIAFIMLPQLRTIQIGVLVIFLAGMYVLPQILFSATTEPATEMFIIGAILFALHNTIVGNIFEETDSTTEFSDPSQIAPFRAVEEQVRQEIERARRFDYPVASLYCIPRGERSVLVDALLLLTYSTDIICQYEDGLLVFLPHTDRRQAQSFVHKLNTVLREKRLTAPQVGISVFPEDGAFLDSLIGKVKESQSPANEIVATEEIGERKGEVPVDVTQRIKIQDDTLWMDRTPTLHFENKRRYMMLKQAIDSLAILLTMPFLMPIMAVISLAIYIDDRGPIFYTQPRIGQNGRQFRIFKFRTMYVNSKDIAPTKQVVAEAGAKVLWPEKTENDPRVTRVGRVLRKLSLDELPQLINIMIGDMSLVGPRPTSCSLDVYTPLQMSRLSVRPGLTGPWQISKDRTRDFDERLIWDLKYIEKMSLPLDFLIIFRTFMWVLQGRNT